MDKKYSCNLCTELVDDNYRVICPFCNIEICEHCFQYSITMDLKDPLCIYCKKHLSLEFVLANNDTKWCKEIFIPYFENLCLEKEKNFLTDTMPKFLKILKVRQLKVELKKFPITTRAKKKIPIENRRS